MKKFLFLIVLISPLLLHAQQVLDLDTCYDLAEKNYPLAQQSDLLKNKIDSEINTIKKEQYPKLDLNAQATYQSDVIEFPLQLPNVTIEAPNKDQYRATLDANQLIYNGGIIAATTQLKTAELQSQQQQVVVNLYQLKSRINQYYFGTLLFQKHLELLNTKKEQLALRLAEVNSGIKFGAVLASAGQIIEAELLKIEQQISQANFDRKKALDNLSSLINMTFDDDIILSQPISTLSFEAKSKRPELKLFELKEQEIEASKEVNSKLKYPKVMGFAQVGYGNPGLNMLDNSFQDFYMAGIKLHWNIFDWGKTKEKDKVLTISQQLINTERETFNLNNEIQLKELENDRNKYLQLILTDSQIINLREKVLDASNSQLRHGVITASQYIIDFNMLYEAKTDQQIHEIQLGLTTANYLVVKGVSE
ncbi:MAG: TolC family protein [Altibacter sp.]|uniref:TolC family protein n=1 Tax=Altibacter sp. TaxID=2024823 RepID=UPI001DD0CEAD|nr:TolC family protein [Altibacter sp.]MBZ0327996.1 TolC family protein [Altibacter sp.]